MKLLYIVFQVLPTDGEHSLATVGYIWRNVVTVHGNPLRRYIDNSNALDCLSPSHVSNIPSHRPFERVMGSRMIFKYFHVCSVTWQPYNRAEVQYMELNEQCMVDAELWRSVCPLICFFVVEYHLPCRVKRQFGIIQEFPLEYHNTNQHLHK